MFHFRSLGSGSSGNSYLIRTDEGVFLIDAGTPIRRLRRYLAECGVPLQSLHAILLTHDHMDHAMNAGTLQAEAEKQGHHIELYLTAETLEGIRRNHAIRHKPSPGDIHLFLKTDRMEICGVGIEPFDVPHDSRDCCGFFMTYHDIGLCLLTDCGEITPEIESYVTRATHLIVETNYDTDMLLSGPYPKRLKQRIRSSHGHLSNQRAAQLIRDHRGHLSSVYLCHLSQNNNTPELALEAVNTALRITDLFDHVPDVVALPRIEPSDFFYLEK